MVGANASATWYERFAEHMRLKPIDFAMSYVMRSGRIDLERLRKLSPRFVARYEREWPQAAALANAQAFASLNVVRNACAG